MTHKFFDHTLIPFNEDSLSRSKYTSICLQHLVCRGLLFELPLNCATLTGLRLLTFTLNSPNYDAADVGSADF